MELFQKLFGILLIPSRIERLGVAHELVHAHPAGQLAPLRQIAHPAQHAHRIQHRIEAEDPHAARLRFERAQQMFDQSGLASAILAHQPQNAAARDKHRHVVERRLGPEMARQTADGDDGLGR